ARVSSTLPPDAGVIQRIVHVGSGRAGTIHTEVLHVDGVIWQIEIRFVLSLIGISHVVLVRSLVLVSNAIQRHPVGQQTLFETPYADARQRAWLLFAVVLLEFLLAAKLLLLSWA